MYKENPGHKVLKLQLTKEKKINTMQTVGQIPPYHSLSQVYICCWTELRTELVLVTMSFPHPFTGQRWKWQAELTRFKKVTLKTIHSE